MSKPTEIKCNSCGGTGTVEMPEELTETLSMFRGKVCYSAAELSEKTGGRVKHTAFNRRLERLRELRMITRERIGKTFYYSRK